MGRRPRRLTAVGAARPAPTRPGWARPVPGGHDGAMATGIILAVILVLVFPVAVALSGAVASGILGFFLKQTGETVNEGSELIELNR